MKSQEWTVKKMDKYGKGYILKGALLDAVDWDNDIEKWTIRDDDLESLMAQKNDVVEVVRCKDCKHSNQYEGGCWYCEKYEGLFSAVNPNDYCSYGWDGEEECQ